MSYQTIYDQLRAAGLTEAGALALLGNWDCESNCEANRVQGDFSTTRYLSKDYTANVDSGKISKQQFANDQKGFGLAQWTFYTRKEDLYDFCKAQGVSIGNEKAQVAFALKEMPTEAPGLLQELKTSNDLYQCVGDVCCKFERPYYNNVQQRFNAAERIAKMIDLDGGGDTPDPDPDPEPTPEPDEHKLVLRTIDKNCSGFDEVFLLQSALLCRGYIETTPTDVFGSWLDEIVKQFQRDNGLTADGIVGPLSWRKLLEVNGT